MADCKQRTGSRKRETGSDMQLAVTWKTKNWIKYSKNTSHIYSGAYSSDQRFCNCLVRIILQMF